jgi:hypothetical protein
MKIDIEKIVKVIEKHKLVFITELCCFLPFSRPTFYGHKLNTNEEILTALNRNKVIIKHSMRKKWLQSDNPVLQVSLYKLLSTDEELRSLSMQNIEQKTDQNVIISFVNEPS